LNKSDSSKPLAILSAPGSRGDVNPMVAMGRELIGSGFDVAISVAEPYAKVIMNPPCLLDFTEEPHDAPFGKSCSVSPSALDRESASFCESDRKFDHADGLLRPEWIQGRKGPNDKEGSRGDYQRNRGGRLQGWIGRI